MSTTNIRSCECCGKSGIKERVKVHDFVYGEYGDVRVISVEVPVMSCLFCGMDYTD